MITWPQPVIQCRHKIGGTVAVAAALALLGGGTVGPHVIPPSLGTPFPSGVL